MKKVHMYKEAKGKTVSPFVGCLHDCVYCDSSFKRQMKRRKKACSDCYNYIPHSHLERIIKGEKWVPPPKTEPNEFIFLCDFADVTFAPEDVMQTIIDWTLQYRDRTFLIQSKNPRCFHQYIFPFNVILGTTIETNREVFDTPSEYLFYRAISKAPLPIMRYRDMVNLMHQRKLITNEPILDFDLDVLVSWIKEIKPEVVYIGYDSHPDKNKLPEPPLWKFDLLKSELEKFTEVRVKERRKAWWE